MQRRELIKSAAAAAVTPLMPSSVLASPFTGAQYAKAIEVANLWAYTTVGNLKLALGVDQATSEAVLRQLQIDGVIGQAGPSGIALTQKFVREQAAIAAKTAQRTFAPKRDLEIENTAKELLLGEDEDLPSEVADPLEDDK